MWERTAWGTGRAASGTEGRKGRSEERGSSVEEQQEEEEGGEGERWRARGKRLTSDLLGGSP